MEEKKAGVYVPPKVAAMPYGQFCLFWRLFFCSFNRKHSSVFHVKR